MSSFSNTSNNPYLGWETARDPSTGNVYYFHRDSGLTSWEWPPPMLLGMGWETSAASAPAAAIGAAGGGAFPADPRAAQAAAPSASVANDDDDEQVVLTARSALGARAREVASAPAPQLDPRAGSYGAWPASFGAPSGAASSGARPHEGGGGGYGGGGYGAP